MPTLGDALEAMRTTHPEARVKLGRASDLSTGKLLEIAEGARGLVMDWFFTDGMAKGVNGFGYGVRWDGDEPTDEPVFEVYAADASVTLDSSRAAKLFATKGAASLATALRVVRDHPAGAASPTPAAPSPAPAAVRVQKPVRARERSNEPGALQHRVRPLAGGCSIGTPNITAGTLGVRVDERVRSWTRGAKALVLSNCHVLADNVHAPVVGTALMQPGATDGGLAARDTVGALYRAVKLQKPPMVNYLDAALAEITDPTLLDDGLTNLGTPMFWRSLKNTPIGTRVAKVGRTTGLTFGYLRAVGVTYRVDYGTGAPLIFCDQMYCSRLGRGGDSGSVVFTVGKYPAIVGLLLGGSDDITVATPIETVHDKLGITTAPRQWGVDPPVDPWPDPVRSDHLYLDPRDPAM